MTIYDIIKKWVCEFVYNKYGRKKFKQIVAIELLKYMYSNNIHVLTSFVFRQPYGVSIKYYK